MGHDELDRLLIRDSATIRSAMQAITDNWREVALVVDDAERLVGVITDGDIRRGLLRGLTLESAAADVMTRQYVSVGPELDRAGVLDLMKARSIRHVPVLDEGQRVVGVHFLEVLIGRTERPNWAVIMAGGEGRRLRPLTDARPKPMVPVAGRPILERIVLHLVGFGIRRIFVSVNYLAEMIIDHFGDGSKFGCSIEYLREGQALGTGGPLSLLPERPDHPLLVMNGDLVTQVDVARLLSHHTARRAWATMAVRDYQVEIPFGVVGSRNGLLTELAEKPTAQYQVSAGIYVLEPSALGMVPPATFFPITALFERMLGESRPVAVYSLEEDWIDVGRREELNRANGRT